MATLSKVFNFKNDLEGWSFIFDEGTNPFHDARWKAPRRPIHGPYSGYPNPDLVDLGGSMSVYQNSNSGWYSGYLMWQGTWQQLSNNSLPSNCTINSLKGSFNDRWIASGSRNNEGSVKQRKQSSLIVSEESTYVGEFYAVGDSFNYLGTMSGIDFCPIRDGWGSGNNWAKWPISSGIKDTPITETPSCWQTIGGSQITFSGKNPTDIVELRISVTMPDTPENDPTNDLYYYLACHIDRVKLDIGYTPFMGMPWALLERR